MTTQEFFTLIETIVELPPGAIVGNELLSTLKGWDSLAAIGFMAAVNKKVGIIIAPKDLVAAQTVGDLLKLVESEITQ